MAAVAVCLPKSATETMGHRVRVAEYTRCRGCAREVPLAARARFVLGVSPSGYYAWRGRERCSRVREDEELCSAIGAIHEESRGTYGVPRGDAELVAKGCRVSRKRVARLMGQAGLAGVSRRRGTRTTCADPSHPAAPDRVER